MQGNSQLDHTKIGTEVSPRAADVRDEELPDLDREFVQLFGAHPTQVAGLVNRIQQGHG